MKQIFDWMREQISDHLNHCREMEAQSRTKFEEFGYGSRVDAYNRAIEYINEAEVKWEAEIERRNFEHRIKDIIPILRDECLPVTISLIRDLADALGIKISEVE